MFQGKGFFNMAGGVNKQVNLLHHLIKFCRPHTVESRKLCNVCNNALMQKTTQTFSSHISYCIFFFLLLSVALILENVVHPDKICQTPVHTNVCSAWPWVQHLAWNSFHLPAAQSLLHLLWLPSFLLLVPSTWTVSQFLNEHKPGLDGTCKRIQRTGKTLFKCWHIFVRAAKQFYLPVI